MFCIGSGYGTDCDPENITLNKNGLISGITGNKHLFYLNWKVWLNES